MQQRKLLKRMLEGILSYISYFQRFSPMENIIERNRQEMRLIRVQSGFIYFPRHTDITLNETSDKNLLV